MRYHQIVGIQEKGQELYPAEVIYVDQLQLCRRRREVVQLFRVLQVLCMCGRVLASRPICKQHSLALSFPETPTAYSLRCAKIAPQGVQSVGGFASVSLNSQYTHTSLTCPRWVRERRRLSMV